ncbi:MAG: hypothetical protein WEA09_00245 [Gemmatimonadota bacterium]
MGTADPCADRLLVAGAKRVAGTVRDDGVACPRLSSICTSPPLPGVDCTGGVGRTRGGEVRVGGKTRVGPSDSTAGLFLTGGDVRAGGEFLTGGAVRTGGAVLAGGAVRLG